MNKQLQKINQLKKEIEQLKLESDGTPAYQDALDILNRDLADLYFDLKGTTAFALKLTDENYNEYYLSDNKKQPVSTIVTYFDSEDEIKEYLTLDLKEAFVLTLERKSF